MRRLLPLIVLYVVLAQTTGLTWASTEETCATDCSDDASDRGGQCPPNCPDCVCSIHLPATFTEPPVIVVAPAPPPRAVEFVEPNDAMPSPAPREIQHVPRALLV